MTALTTAALIWGVVIWIFVRGRFGPSMASWTRAIAFKPKEEMSPEQLFGCLLSGNFALLMRDNFNQIGSSLSERRIGRVLREHWGVETRADCLRMIESRRESLGKMSPPEKRAIAAWLTGERVDSNEYAAIEDTCRFMALRAHITHVDELRNDHLSVLAWDIQQLAYLVRLACAVGHVSKPSAEEILGALRTRARAHYGSWKDYSLAALIGLGMRGSLEVFDHAEWTQFARTHAVFLNERRSPTKSASRWTVAAVQRDAPAAPARFESGSRGPAAGAVAP
ncbi:DUF1266 domain-containing protein [Variovorax sp. M-6]|uniref:DUF1266 domain-containing protein n=1 Tax=Variovorax sp. M-6 TaxID=3233041 RepID=UPI003F9DEA7F